MQGRLVNLSCSSVPSFVVSITATTQVGPVFESVFYAYAYSLIYLTVLLFF